MAAFHGSPPNETVIAAFGLHGTAVPLAGGQGESFLLTDTHTNRQVVFKPAHDPFSELEFVASMQQRLLSLAPTPAYRIAAPIPLLHPIAHPSPSPDEPTTLHYTHTDPNSQQAWTATLYLPFTRGDPSVRPASVLHASRAFHADLLHLYPPTTTPPPTFLVHRTSRWSWADRYAWSELPLAHIPNLSPQILARIQPHLTRLEALLTTTVADLTTSPDPAVNTSQLIHGDLSGNLLFDTASDGNQQPPAIIDFSLYHRPVAYAEGIVGADLLLWRKGDVQMLKDLGLLDGWGRRQVLVRACVFRVVTFAVEVDEAWVERHLGVLDLEGTVGGLEEVCGEMGS